VVGEVVRQCLDIVRLGAAQRRFCETTHRPGADNSTRAVRLAFDHRGQHDRQVSRALRPDAEVVAHTPTIRTCIDDPAPALTSDTTARRRTRLAESVNAPG
jgi:hypothetical protein